VVAVIGAQRFDPIALALSLGADLARLFQRRPGGLRVRPRRHRGERVAEQVDRDSPMRHRATGIVAQDLLERSPRDQEPVRMDHRDAALELGLHLGIAGGGEAQLAELLILLGERAAGQQRDDACR
jgi:hypothetical protein